MIRKALQKHRELIAYLFFGVTTTLVNWCIYGLLHEVLSLNMTLSNAAAWLGAVIYAFVTNKLFVFESKSLGLRKVLGEALAFFASRGFSGLVEIFLPTALFALGLNGALFGIEGGIAKALVSVLIIVMNYVLSKFFVFRKK